MSLSDFLCKPIYIMANKFVTRCRSEQESKQLYASFNRHFGIVHENERKAKEYERIMSEKDKLIEAVQAVKAESVDTKNEMTELKMYIFQLEEDNETMRSLIALICQLHTNEEWERLDDVIRMLSNQYLKDTL